ncbi:CDP-alcohol phosphatidyltransferase family protein [Patescibacteria group bacterium]|nr:CDP-alcohol phosphatidyltransferase family protein [Patescibacteria group bacterium]
MLQSLPWELKAFVYLSAALLVAIATLAIPKSWLVRIGQLPFLSPNWISFWRLPIFWVGAYLFYYTSSFFGLLIIVLACCLDVIDGKMAKAMRDAGIIRSALDLWIGVWLDPLVDKLTLLPLIGIISSAGLIDTTATFCIILFDVIGTSLRDPFNVWERMKRRFVKKPELRKTLSWHPYRAHLELTADKEPSETKANPIGKIKSLLQSLGLALCGPYILHWVELDVYPTYWFSLAALFGLMSVLSRHLNISTLRRITRWSSSYFNHQDI